MQLSRGRKTEDRQHNTNVGEARGERLCALLHRVHSAYEEALACCWYFGNMNVCLFVSSFMYEGQHGWSFAELMDRLYSISSEAMFQNHHLLMNA